MSRDPDLLHPELKKRWEYLKRKWKEENPDKLQPFLFTTYRSPAQQKEEYRQGETNARPGQSLHNYNPSYAFDFAMGTIGRSRVQWQDKDGIYTEFASMAKELGLEWGGDWENDGVDDIYHLQMPMTYEDAQDGNIPELPPLPGEDQHIDKEKVNKILDDLETKIQDIRNVINN